MKDPPVNRNFYLFNYQKYLKSKQIYRIFTIQDLKIVAHSKSILFKLKNKIYHRSQTLQNKAYYQLFLLNLNTFEEETKKLYKETDILYLMHISGFFFIFLYQKGKAWLPFDKRFLFFLLLAFLFFLQMMLFSFPPLMFRSWILWVGYMFVQKKKIAISYFEVSMFLFSVFFMFQPSLIYSSGFLFSFLITIAIFIAKPALCSSKKRAVFLCFLSFYVTLPIVINQNFEISLLTPFIRLILTPFFITFFIPILFLSFLLPILEPLLTFNIVLLETFTKGLQNLSFFTFPLAHISKVEMILFYITIGYSLFHKRKKYAFLPFLLLLFFHYHIHYLKPATFTMIDVGQGDCLLFSLPKNGGNIVIDTGGKENFKSNGEEVYTYAQNTIIPSLKSRGIHQIDTLIITHGDADHSKESIPLIKNFPVKKVLMNSGSDTEIEKELLTELKTKNIPYQKISNGNLKIPNGKIMFLNDQNKKDENQDSLITYINYQSFHILLMGDATEIEENYLLKTYKLPKMDILKVGHHGSKGSSSKPFLKEIQPTYAFISVAQKNLYGHPHPDTINRLTKSRIYQTSTNGMVEATLTKTITIRTCQ